MIEITSEPIQPEKIINSARTPGSGCVATYVGLIRDNSYDKQVVSVQYTDKNGRGTEALKQIATATGEVWKLENISIVHRIGVLKPGDINLVVAVAAAHRLEAFAACQFIINRFKESLPTDKIETYSDGSSLTE